MLHKADNAQLVIVDVQEKVLPGVAGREGIVKKIGILSRMARELDVPITLSEHYPRGLGPTVAEVKEMAGHAAHIGNKIHFSCMADEGLRNHFHSLRDKGRGHAVVSGIEAHVCVLQTAIGMHDAGFEVSLAADAISSRSERDALLALERARDHGIDIVTAEMVAFEWLEKAGSEAFKVLSGLLKAQSR